MRAHTAAIVMCFLTRLPRLYPVRVHMRLRIVVCARACVQMMGKWMECKSPPHMTAAFLRAVLTLCCEMLSMVMDVCLFGVCMRAHVLVSRCKIHTSMHTRISPCNATAHRCLVEHNMWASNHVRQSL